MTADILPFATKKPVTPDPTFGAREALFAAVDELMLGQTSAKAVDKMTDYLLGRLRDAGFVIIPLDMGIEP